MREILFKAKREDNNEWVEGYYWTNLMNNHFIRIAKDKNERFTIEDFEVIPETICQFTGMRDIYGNEIWENDIARYKDDDIVTIEWDDDYRAFAVTDGTWTENLGEFEKYELEVYGNIFDNYELLEVEK